MRGPEPAATGTPAAVADRTLADARRLLADHIYREVAFERLCEVSGDTVVLDPGPGFIRDTAQLMPRALAVAELRFERVIVLPTTFDLSCDAVREAVGRTRATLLDPVWLRAPDPPLGGGPALHPDALPGARVTAVILSCEQPERALRAVDSVRAAGLDTAVLVIDNNLPAADAAMLEAGVRNRTGVALHRSDRNLGTGGGRSFAVAHTRSDYVLFLDDDAELASGALERLVAELDEHPEADAVTATVVMSDGRVQHSGGWVEVTSGVALFTALGEGVRPEELPESGPVGWVPGTAVLVRRELFTAYPIDLGLAAYYEDNEWCHRIALDRPGTFRRSREAIAVHERTAPSPPPQDFTMRSRAVELLAAHAQFYARHGLLLAPSLFDLVHQLRDDDGEPDIASARLLLELVLTRGPDWIFMEWMNGGLHDLLHGRLDRHRLARRNAELEHELAECRRQQATQQAWIDEHTELLGYLYNRHETLQRVEQGGWWQLRQRALPVLQILWRIQKRTQR